MAERSCSYHGTCLTREVSGDDKLFLLTFFCNVLATVGEIKPPRKVGAEGARKMPPKRAKTHQKGAKGEVRDSAL